MWKGLVLLVAGSCASLVDESPHPRGDYSYLKAPLEALIHRYFPTRAPLVATTGRSDFSISVLLLLNKCNKSLLLLDNPSSAPLGIQLVYVHDRVPDNTTVVYVGPTYAIFDWHMGTKMPPLFYGPHVEPFGITRASMIYSLEKSTMQFFPLYYNGSFDKERINIRNKQVVVATLNCTIFSSIGRVGPNGRPDWFDGVEMRLFVQIAGSLGLNWTLHAVKDFGDVYPNGTVTEGLHSDLLTGKADIGFCSLWILEGNYNRTDLISPRHLHCSRFLVPRPRLLPFTSSDFIRTYTPTVWLFVALTTVIVGLVFNLNDQAIHDSNERKWKSVTWFQTLSILLQNNYPDPRRVRRRNRWLNVCWVLFSFLLAVGFSSHMASLLATGKAAKKLNSVKQLVASKCPWSINTFPSYLKKFSEEKKLKPLQTTYAGNISAAERTKLLKENCFAELVETIGQIAVIRDYRGPAFYNDFEASEQTIKSHLFSFAVKKGSPLSQSFQDMRDRYEEVGLTAKIYHDVVSSVRFRKIVVFQAFQYATSASRRRRARPLSLKTLGSLFYMILSGYLIASVILLLEIAFGYRKKQNETESTYLE